MRHAWLLLLVVGCATSTPPVVTPAPTGPIDARVLFERHKRAVGGERTLASKTGAKIRFQISYPNRGVKGTGEVVIGSDESNVVLELEGIGRVEKKYDDAWATDLRFDANLATHFTDAKTIGQTTLDGINVYEVDAAANSGRVILSFDANSGELLAKRAESITVRYTDYQDFGGFRCARIITQRTGDQVQVIELQSIEIY